MTGQGTRDSCYNSIIMSIRSYGWQETKDSCYNSIVMSIRVYAVKPEHSSTTLQALMSCPFGILMALARASQWDMTVTSTSGLWQFILTQWCLGTTVWSCVRPKIRMGGHTPPTTGAHVLRYYALSTDTTIISRGLPR